MNRPDIIRWVIERMLAHDDSISQEMALLVEREARAEWGGEKHYVHKAVDRRDGRKPLAPEAERAVYEAGISSTPTEAIIQQHGVSRATLYRLMKRGPRQPDHG